MRRRLTAKCHGGGPRWHDAAAISIVRVKGRTHSERLPVLLHRTPTIIRGRRSRDRRNAGQARLCRDGAGCGRHRSQGVFEKYYDYDAYDGYDAIGGRQAARIAMGGWECTGPSFWADASKLAHLRAAQHGQHGKRKDHSVEYGAHSNWAQLTWASPRLWMTPRIRREGLLRRMSAWYSGLPIRGGLSPWHCPELRHPTSMKPRTPITIRVGKRSNAVGKVLRADRGRLMHVAAGTTFICAEPSKTGACGRLEESDALLIGPWTPSGIPQASRRGFGPDAAIGTSTRNFTYAGSTLARRVKTAASTRRRFAFTWAPATDTKFGGRLFHGGEWHDSTSGRRANRAPRCTICAMGAGVHPPAASEPSTTFQFDPEHPVPTIGGAVSKRLKDGAHHVSGNAVCLLARSLSAAARAQRCAGVPERDIETRRGAGGAGGSHAVRGIERH